MKISCCPVTATYLITLLVFVKYGSAVLCYDCNSAFDPRCGVNFDPFSLGVVNCSLKDPLDHLPLLPPSICRIVKMDMKGEVRVVRSCGYVTDEAVDDQPCQRRTSSDLLIMTYCSCTTDLCNSAVVPTGAWMGILAAILFTVNFKFSG